MSSRLLSFALAAGLAVLAAGCFLDGTAFQAAGGGGGGAGEPAGGGGSGGATHGTTSAGGSGSAGGAKPGSTTGDTASTGTTGETTTESTTGETTTTTATTTPGGPCTYDLECVDPEPFNICLDAACVGGVCVEKLANEGVACGLPQQCQDFPTCQSGQCTPNPLPFGEPLFDLNTKDCKKPVCDGNGNATSVADDSQVPDSTECAVKTCENGVVKLEPKSGAQTCVLGALKCCSGHCCDPFTCLGCID